MPKTTSCVTAALVAALSASCALAASSLHSKTDRVSYAIGVQTGKAFKQHHVTLNANVFAEGIQDAMTGDHYKMTDQAMTTTISKFRQESIANMQSEMKQEANANLQAGQAYLKNNAKKTGVVTTTSGLQYKVITPGKGTSPGPKDIVTVNYAGKLISGKEFDSSYKRGKPAQFPVNGVIKGWQEALQLMKPGATWQLYIPANLAYGETGAPGAIGPNQALIFKVQLISVKKA